MKINKVSPSFTGYSNVIANEIKTFGERHLFFTVHLDDIGTPDLTKYKSIKRMQGLPESEVNNPVLTVLFSDVEPNSKHYYFNDTRLHLGSGLRKLEQKVLSEDDLNRYAGTKKFHMQVYDLLASITRRMMNDNIGERNNENFNKVFLSATYKLTEIFQNRRTADEFMFVAKLKKEPPFQAVAGEINHKIVKTMEAFFK